MTDEAKKTLYDLRAEALARIEEVVRQLNVYTTQAKQIFAKEQPVIDMANDTLGDWTPPAQEDNE